VEQTHVVGGATLETVFGHRSSFKKNVVGEIPAFL